MQATEYYTVPNQEFKEYPLVAQLPKEIVWSDIKEGYTIRPDGTVTSPMGRTVSPQQQGRNWWVALRRVSRAQALTVRVDRLVLGHFGPAPQSDGLVPVHLDGDPANCSLENLKWGTQQESDELLDPEKSWVKPSHSTKKPKATKKRGRPAKSVIPQPKKKVEEVQALRIYRLGSVEATVESDGTGELQIGDKFLTMSAGQWNELGKVVARVQEFYSLMGLPG